MKRKLFSLTVLLLLTLCLILNTGAQETEPVKSGQFGDNVTWNLYADGTLIFSGTGATKDSEDYITEGWFTAEATVKHVIFEEGITYIGKCLFYNGYAGVFDSLETITIPSTVERIGDFCFTNLRGLKGVYISDLAAWCEIVFDGTDANPLCNNVDLYLNGEPISDLVIPDSVRKIPDYAFYGSAGIHTVTVHKNVTDIGSLAFNSCGCLKHLVFQGGAVDFGNDVFTLSDLNAYYPAGNSSWDSVIGGDYGGSVAWIPYSGSAPEITDDTPCNRVLWDYDEETQTLTLSGYGHTGDFVAYHSDYPRPEWDLCKDNVTHIVVEEGITGLGDFAFYRYLSLTSVSLPSTLTTIGRGTFLECNLLTDVELPERLTEMGMSAFESTGIRSVRIPTTMTTIPAFAFKMCTYLEEVELHDGITTILAGAFQHCNALPVLPLPEKLQVLENDVYPSISAKLVTLPATLNTYGDRAILCAWDLIFTGPAPLFWSKAFESQTVTVYYPENDPTWTEDIMQQYGGNVTWVCGSGPVEEPDPGNIQWEFDIHANALTITGIGAMPDYTDRVPWFRYLDRMGSVTIGEGITHIGSNAFANCYVLSQVELPSTLESIGDSAFSGCSNLAEIGLPEHLTTIGSNAFKGTQLKAVTIPASVESLGSGVFLDCARLQEIIFTGNPPAFTADALAGVTATCGYPGDNTAWTEDVLQSYGGTVNWRATMAVSGEPYGDHGRWTFDPSTGTLTISSDGFGPLPTDNPYTWEWSCPWENYRDMVKTVVFSEGVTNTGTATLWNHSAVTEVILPSTLTSIDQMCFDGCSSLKEITLPERLQYIGLTAFNNSGLVHLTIPDGVTSIEDSAFRNCSNLVSVRLPAGLESTGSFVFSNCSALTEISIPEMPNLIGFGYYLFENCDALTNIDFWNLPIIPGYTFTGCDGLVNLTIPDGVTQLAFEGTPFNTGGIFYNCANLKTVTIPASVQKIGDSLFSTCPALEAIYFLGNAPELDDYALPGAPVKVYYPKDDPTWTAEFRSQYDVLWTPFGGVPSPFGDVADTDYFFQPVLWAVDKEITSGTGHGNFSPNATCTRAQVVTFLWRAKGSPAPSSTSNPFTDVAPGDYFYEAVLWAVENGITTGMNDTTFAPNNPCNRAQVVTFLWRTMGQPTPEKADNPFSDVAADQWYYAPVLWAVENGITTGTTATTFAPSNPCTRGQVVTFLFRTFSD